MSPKDGLRDHPIALGTTFASRPNVVRVRLEPIYSLRSG